MQRCGQARCLERELAVQIELQRQAQEILFDIAADQFDQAQGFAIAAEQQVLAVVELRVVVQHAARASAELLGAFKYGDRDAARGQCDCGCHAGVAAADDGSVQYWMRDVSCYSLTADPLPERGDDCSFSLLGEGWERECHFSS